MEKRHYFLLVSVIGIFAIFSSTMSKSPILPIFANALIHNPTELQYIGYVFSASTIPGILISIFAGRLSDLYGREKLLFVSALVFATAPFFYIFATNIYLLMIIRFYHGFSTAIFVPVATAAIAEAYPERKGERISLFSSLTLVGRFFAPITGGTILYITNYYFYGVYIACGISGILALVFSLVLLHIKAPAELDIQRKTSERVFTLKNFMEGLRIVFQSRRILVTSMVQASQYFAYGIVEAFIILYMEYLNYPAWVMGVVPSILIFLFAVVKPIMGHLSDKYGRKMIISGGLLLTSFSMLLVVYLPLIAFILVSVSLFGIGMAMITSSTSAYVADLIDKELYGGAIGTLSTIMDIGQAAGPIIAGYILVYYGFSWIFLMVSLLLILSLVVFAKMG